MSKAFIFNGITHYRGDMLCGGCGGGRMGYPQPHKCGGSVHHNFLDECLVCDFLNYMLMCDKCDYTYTSEHEHPEADDAS